MLQKVRKHLPSASLVRLYPKSFIVLAIVHAGAATYEATHGVAFYIVLHTIEAIFSYSEYREHKEK